MGFLQKGQLVVCIISNLISNALHVVRLAGEQYLRVEGSRRWVLIFVRAGSDSVRVLNKPPARVTIFHAWCLCHLAQRSHRGQNILAYYTHIPMLRIDR